MFLVFRKFRSILTVFLEVFQLTNAHVIVSLHICNATFSDARGVIYSIIERAQSPRNGVLYLRGGMRFSGFANADLDCLSCHFGGFQFLGILAQFFVKKLCHNVFSILINIFAINSLYKLHKNL